MRAPADQQQFFVFVVRPAASLVAAAGLGVAIALGERPQGLLLGLAVAVVAAAALSALAAWRLPVAWVIRAGLLADTVLLATAAVGLDAPFRVALGYLWAIGAAAVVLGSLDAAAFGVLALAAVAAAPLVVGYAVEPRLLGATEGGLVLVGAALAAATRPGRRAQALLAKRAAQDAAALEISERMRASLAREAVLQTAAAEICRSLRAGACTVLLPADDSERQREFTWSAFVAPDLRESARTLAEAALERRRQVALDGDGDSTSGFAAPIGWGDDAVAVVALADRRPRAWDEAPLLLERLGPQLAAALAQADAYAQQQETIATLERFDEQRQQLVAAVSHELRTPITATLGFLETMLARPDLPADEQRRFLHEAAAGARRLARLVDDLLVLTRTERRTLSLQRQRVEPAWLLERALTGLIVPAGREVVFRADGDCTVNGDPDRLLQVFANLLSNAIGHGRGTITVECRRRGDRVVIEFADEGPPIPDAQLGQLFVAFARFGATEGTGLGLSIARSLAEAHGGSLAYHRPPGGRHAFVLELPAGAAHGSGAPESARLAPTLPG